MIKILSENVEYARQASLALGLHFDLIDQHSGYLCEISNAQRHVHIAGGSINSWPVNSASAQGLATDKPFCAQVLERHGLRVPRGSAVFLSERFAALRAPGRELADVSALVEPLGWPVITKPATGSRGAFVRSCADLSELLTHLKAMGNRYDIGLIQEMVIGIEWRVVVFDGHARWAYRKKKSSIIGDGSTTIRSLVDSLNTKLISHGIDPIEADSSWFHKELLRLGLKLDNVLAEGLSIDPGPRGNIAAGGLPEGLTETPPESIAMPAIQAAEAVGLSIAGIDLIVPQGEVPFVLEVNGNPAVSAVEKVGRSDLAIQLWHDVLIKIFDEKGQA